MLLPLRIGGNEDETYNVYIKSFKDPKYQYLPTAEIVRDSTLDHVTDYRFGEIRRPDDIWLDDFDLDEFTTTIQKRQYTPSELRVLALSFGNKSHLMRDKKQTLPRKTNRPKGVAVSNNSNKMTIFNPLESLNLRQAQHVPIGVLINNPMAVKKFQDWEGELSRAQWPDYMTWRGDKMMRTDLLRFGSPDMGIRCGIRVFRNKQRRGLVTVRDMITDYAPYKGAGADNSEQETLNYIADVSRYLNVRPDDEIVVSDYETAYKLVEAVILRENAGVMPYSEKMIRSGLMKEGISLPQEAPPDIKPPMQSDERGGAILIGTANTLPPAALLIKWMVDNLGVTEEQARELVEGGGKYIGDAVAAASPGMSWADMFVVGTCVAAWIGLGAWGAWKLYQGRARAGRLLLR